MQRLVEKWLDKAEKNVPLKEMTTFQIGGPADYVIRIDNPDELIEFVLDFKDSEIPWRLLGGGSNILASDDGFRGVIVVYTAKINSVKLDGNKIKALGGVMFHDLSVFAAHSGLSGLEFATGIPGTFGGAIYGNAGAFGVQIGDILTSITLLDKQGNISNISAKDMKFEYRNSTLKTSGSIVLEAEITLKKGRKKDILQELTRILDFRKSRHPDYRKTPCAGSFFRNLEPTSKASKRQAAGAFLDKSGAKSMTCGKAAVYPKHANIIINSGGATCDDILGLAEMMKKAVKDKYEIELEREVIHLYDEMSR